MKQYSIRFLVLYALIALTIFFCGSIVYMLHSASIDLSPLQQEKHGRASVLLDYKGEEWGRFQLEKRKYISLDRVPEHVIYAFVTVEDRNFFKHSGISVRGIIRSLLINLYHGRKVQGASTITQQLVRLLFFDAEKTFKRKIKEQLYSILVERRCSKEQILETYLNNVYFGYGIYGIQAAAQRFWDKNIEDVSIDEAALLAAIMKSPRYYCPIHAPLAALKRRNLILKKMESLSFISQEMCQKALDSELYIQELDHNVIAPHMKESIRIFMEDLVGREKLYAGGLIIQTTLDKELQLTSQKAFQDKVKELKIKVHEDIDGGLLAIDPTTGEIRAMIGGYDFKTSKLNRSLQAVRQMGSIFKPFVYAAALEQGAQFYDVELDEPFSLTQNNVIWKPENSTKQYLGPITRACALSISNNIIAIKTLLRAGIQNVIQVAKRCYLKRYIPPYPSLALGCLDCTLCEAIGAFNIFANNGIYVEPYMIKWVKNKVGDKIYKATTQKSQALDPCIADQVARVLSFSMMRLSRVIGKKWIGVEAIGKTGTTNDSRTCWFCGSTPQLTIAMYLGCDDNQSLGNKIYASKTAFPIWFEIQNSIAQNKTSFYHDARLKEVFVHWKTGVFCQRRDESDIVPLLVKQ